MKLLESIHCGVEVWKREIGSATEILTEHRPSTWLTEHAHSESHWVRVISGGFLDWVDGKPTLRLVGDMICYEAGQLHTNRFGKRPSTCLNLQGKLETSRERNSLVESVANEINHQPEVTIEQLGLRLGYHPVYLARVVRKETGLSLASMRTRVRLQLAASQIMNTASSLGEVAIETGFCDQSHLTDTLSKEAGFTPNELRAFADTQ